MESTGVYWIPVYEILEARGLRVYVVNARHLKNARAARATFRIASGFRACTVSACCAGRSGPKPKLWRCAPTCGIAPGAIEYRAAHIQHMQKALQQMNVQLTQVLTDITGVTGLAIIRAIVAGERNPQQLAALRQRNCKQNEETIAKALTGNYRREHLFALEQALTLYDVYTEQMRACDAEIVRQFANLKPIADDLPPVPPLPKSDSHSKNGPAYDARTLLYQLTGVDLVAISGLNASTVQTIIAEIGPNVDAFRRKSTSAPGPAWRPTTIFPAVNGCAVGP